jgi:hypothetical protein
MKTEPTFPLKLYLRISAVTLFGCGKNEKLPAPKAGGLYKTDGNQRGLSVPRFPGRRGRVSFQTESPLEFLTACLHFGYHCRMGIELKG